MLVVNVLVSVSRHRGPGGTVITAVGRAVILGVPADRRSALLGPGRVQRPACTSRASARTPGGHSLHGSRPSQRSCSCARRHGIPAGSKVCPSLSACPPSRGPGRVRELRSETVSSSLRACLGGTQPPGVYSIIRMPASTSCLLGRGARGSTHNPCGRVDRRLGEAGASSLPSSLLRGSSPPRRALWSFISAGVSHSSLSSPTLDHLHTRPHDRS